MSLFPAGCCGVGGFDKLTGYLFRVSSLDAALRTRLRGHDDQTLINYKRIDTPYHEAADENVEGQVAMERSHAVKPTKVRMSTTKAHLGSFPVLQGL